MSNKYPCEGCVVRASCSKDCTKLENDRDKLCLHFMYLEYSINFKCPDCGHDNGNVPANADVITVYCNECNHCFSIYMTCAYLVDNVKREKTL